MTKMKLSLAFPLLFLTLASSSPTGGRKRDTHAIQNNPRNRIQHHSAIPDPEDTNSLANAPPLPNDILIPGPLPGYTPSGVSPWNDNGQSEVKDYQDTWTYCPERYLNCRRCPYDPRCYGVSSTSLTPSAPSAPATPTRRPRPWVYAPPSLIPGEEGAFTGPQIKHHGADVDDKEGERDTCPLKRCGEGGAGDCDFTTATCVQGYCACSRGTKAAEGNIMLKAEGILVATGVFVDVGVACNRLCQDRFCSEVQEGGSCFKGDDKGSNSQKGVGEYDPNDISVPVPQKPGTGAIKLPGVGDGAWGIAE